MRDILAPFESFFGRDRPLLGAPLRNSRPSCQRKYPWTQNSWQEQTKRLVTVNLICQGRCAIFESANYPQLYEMALKMENAGFTVSIIETDRAKRQLLAWVEILDWLKLLQSRMNLYHDMVRSLICEELLVERDDPLQPDDKHTDESTVLGTQGHLRIDSLLSYDIFLWNHPRRSLKEILLKTLVTDPKFQKDFGLRFCLNYTRLANSFLLYDAFPDLSLLHVSLEFFRSPTLSHQLVLETPIFRDICDFLRVCIGVLICLFRRITRQTS